MIKALFLIGLSGISAGDWNPDCWETHGGQLVKPHEETYFYDFYLKNPPGLMTIDYCAMNEPLPENALNV